MIEINWFNVEDADYLPQLVKVTEFMSWLAVSIMEEASHHKIELRGYVIIRDQGKISILLMTDNTSGQSELMEMLKEPPSAYNEKYYAFVVNEEPNPVSEKSPDYEDETDNDESIDENGAQAAVDS